MMFKIWTVFQNAMPFKTLGLRFLDYKVVYTRFGKICAVLVIHTLLEEFVRSEQWKKVKIVLRIKSYFELGLTYKDTCSFLDVTWKRLVSAVLKMFFSNSPTYQTSNYSNVSWIDYFPRTNKVFPDSTFKLQWNFYYWKTLLYPVAKLPFGMLTKPTEINEWKLTN